jgi:hypothetical protein
MFDLGAVGLAGLGCYYEFRCLIGIEVVVSRDMYFSLFMYASSHVSYAVQVQSVMSLYTDYKDEYTQVPGQRHGCT